MALPRNPQLMTINPNYHPQIDVIAGTPYDVNGNFAYNVHHSGPYFPRPFHSSSISNYSSALSRKSTADTGYGSGSVVYPGRFSSYASNHMYCSRCACNREPDAYQVDFHQQQQEEPQKPVQHDHYESVTANRHLLMSLNNNLTTARPSMRRNSVDTNISRHKASPYRPEDNLLSSSSVV